MPSHRKSLVCIILVAGLVGAAFACLPGREPRFQGRRLSDWLLSNRAPLGRPPTHPVSAEELDKAIRKIGKQGLPFLVKWMDWQPGKWRSQLFGCIPMAVRRKSAVQRSVGFQRMVDWAGYRREFALKSGAWRALKVLGPEAAPALPDLAKAAVRWPETYAYQTLEIMMAVGPAAIPTVTNFVASLRTNKFKAEAIKELGAYGFQGAPVIPALLEYLCHTNAEIAAESAGSLGCLALRADLVVPALNEALDRPEPLVRERAALALADYGESAQVAIPKLQRLLAGNSGEAAAAALALRKISPSGFAGPPLAPAAK